MLVNMPMSVKRRKSFTLLAALSDVYKRETEGVIREFLEGGTWGDAELLGTILFDHDGEVRPSELVGLAYTTSAGVTGSLRRLESAGLIERKRVETDRRVLMVCLTDRGRAVTKAARPNYEELADEAIGHLSREDIDWLFDFLTQQLDG